MKKSILFLGVGHLQKYSINSAKTSGFMILGVDIDPNAKSKLLCDHFFNNDSTDAAAIYDWCRSIKDCEILAVWANNDILIPTRASLESALDIKFPHASHQVCFDLLSKARGSEILRDSGFTPEQYDFKQDTQKELNYPIIVKPKKGSGSQGVKLINSKAELEKIEFNSEKQVIEEYIEGIEFGTNHFYDGENIFKLPAVRRYFDHNISMVPLGTVIADMEDEILKKSYTDIEKIIIHNNWLGPIKSDIFIANNQFYIIEMSPRFHGEIDTTFVFHYFGISLSDMYFSTLANSKKDIWKLKLNQRIKTVAGYISICNNTVVSDNKFMEETLKKYGLIFLSFIQSGSKKFNKKNTYPENTSDLVGFVFYSSIKRLNCIEFKNLFKDINLL